MTKTSKQVFQPGPGSTAKIRKKKEKKRKEKKSKESREYLVTLDDLGQNFRQERHALMFERANDVLNTFGHLVNNLASVRKPKCNTNKKQIIIKRNK